MIYLTLDEDIVAYKTCKKRFQKFWEVNFELTDEPLRSSQPKKFEDNDLQDLLDTNPTQTQKELAKQLEVVDSRSLRLRQMGKIKKEGR